MPSQPVVIRDRVGSALALGLAAPFWGGLLGLGAICLVAAGVDWEVATILCAVLAAFLVVRLFALKLVIDEAGVEVVNILRRHELRWSDISQIRLAEDQENTYDDRSLEFVMRDGAPGQSPRTVGARGAAVRAAKSRLLAETLDFYARRHGISSTITVARLTGGAK